MRRLLAEARVVPVLTVEDPGRAVSLVGALAEGGLPTVEITLRTSAAMECVRRVSKEVPGALVGVGSVTRADELAEARDAGARFAVSPGFTGDLMVSARRVGIPWLPGVATPSEAMLAWDAGLDVVKLFPASLLGGPAFLDAIRGPLPGIAFCPTGGVDAASYREYLARPNVVAVGGSWMVPKEASEADDWALVVVAAREVAA